MNSIIFKESNQRISIITCKALDVMGYSKEIVRLRSIEVNSSPQLTETMLGLFDMVLAGSLNEGVSYHSDIDFLFLLKDLICVEAGKHENGITVLEADTSNSPPGYTKLSIYRPQRGNELLINSSSNKSYADRKYISSLRFSNYINRIPFVWGIESVLSEINRHGPAVSFKLSIDGQKCERDLVFAIYFFAFTVLDRWKNRQRYFDWPSKKVIKNVTETTAVLVPATLKESNTADIEWRICFPHGDKELIHGMNQNQIKLYVLLKVIKKDIIDHEVTGLTSYMLKNAVCWVCESMPSELFTPERLLDRLRNAIHFLIECLINNNLPCYFIPDRNLLLEKVSYHEKRKLQMVLANIKAINISTLCKCKDLYEAMELAYQHPTAAENIIKITNACVCLNLKLQTKHLFHENDTLAHFF